MIEQPLGLRDVVSPGDVLDASAGLSALAPIVKDAAVGVRKVVEEVQPRVDALGPPLFDGRVEAAWRHHEQRWAGADHLEAGRDAVNGRDGHNISRPTSPGPAARRAR